MTTSIVPQSDNPQQLPLIPEEEKPRGVVIDGESYIALYDTYRIYGKSKNPTTDWKRDRAKLLRQGYDLTKLLGHNFGDNRNGQKTPIANEEQMARIAQVAEFPEWEPIRQRMAELLVAEHKGDLQYRQDVTAYQLQGRSQDWAWARVESKASHKALSAVLVATHEEHKPDFAEIGAIQNHGLFDMTKRQIVDHLGLLPKDEDKYRDHLGEYALDAVRQVNRTCELRMKKLGRTLTSDEQAQIVRDVVAIVAPSMHKLAEYAGVDFVSGAQLDANGKPLINRNVRLLK